MLRISETAPAYSLPHLLNRDAGGPPFEDVLIIGADPATMSRRHCARSQACRRR